MTTKHDNINNDGVHQELDKHKFRSWSQKQMWHHASGEDDNLLIIVVVDSDDHS